MKEKPLPVVRLESAKKPLPVVRLNSASANKTALPVVRGMSPQEFLEAKCDLLERRVRALEAQVVRAGIRR